MDDVTRLTDESMLMQARVLESMAEGVSVCDENGLYTYTNPAFDRMFGYARGELIGRHVTTLNNQTAEENERIFRGIVDRLTAEGTWSGEFANRKKDGSELHSFARISSLEIGGRLFWVTVQEDITERRRALAQIQTLNAHLAERTRELEAAVGHLQDANRDLEAFNYTVSHDLRSPLSNIKLNAEILLALFGSDLTEKPRQFVRSILEHSERMEGLVDAILDLSDATRGELCRTAVRLTPIAREIADGFHQLDPRRQVQYRFEEVPAVEGDEQLLRNLLQNLLANAWKFTRNRQPARIEFGIADREDRQVFFVRDNGEGFEMSQAGRLFETFQRLHDRREFEGHGIGLASVKRIIQRHGGRVWAEAAPGEGATFFFTLG